MISQNIVQFFITQAELLEEGGIALAVKREARGDRIVAVTACQSSPTSGGSAGLTVLLVTEPFPS